MSRERETSRTKVQIRLKKGQKRLVFLDGSEFLVGRDESVPVCVPVQGISRRHILVKIKDGKVYLRDLASSNGTFIQGRKLRPNEDVLLNSTEEEVSLGNEVWLLITPPQVREASRSAASDDETDEVRNRRSSDRSERRHEERPQEEEKTIASRQSLQMLEQGISSAKKRFENLDEELRKKLDGLRASVREFETKRNDAKREYEVFAKRRDEAAHEAEELRADGDRQASVAMKRVESLRDEWDKIRQKLESAREETDRESVLLSELQEERKRASAEAHAANDDLTRAEEALRDFRERMERETRETRKRVEQDMAAFRQNHISKIEAELERERSKAAAQIAKLKEEIETLQHVQQTEIDTLREWQDNAHREKESQELALRKAKALYETMEAEAKVKTLALETAIGDIEIKQIEAKRELERLVSEREETVRATNKIKAEAERRVEASEERLSELKTDQQRFLDQIRDQQKYIERLKADAAKEGENLGGLKKTVEEVNQQIAASREELERATEGVRLYKQEFEAEKVHLHEVLKKELDGIRSEARRKAESDAKAKQEDLQRDFAEKGKKMELEIADAKLREMEQISKMQEEVEKREKTRRRFMLDEIVRSAVELARQTPLEQAEDQFRNAVHAIIEGKSVGALSVQANERSKDFWKKSLIAASVPLAAGLFFALFPGVPGAIKGQLQRTIASEKKDNGVFLDEILRKGMKYQPDMDSKYRDSYTDNILYLKDYAKMKLDPKEQTSWTLLLNDFIVGRLDLSDRVIPDFIGAESVMVKDLLEIREGILPQFKDQGLARMASSEKQDSESLKKLLQTPENYQKFRDLEKSYYEDYIKRSSQK